jgi:hypothetical protein
VKSPMLQESFQASTYIRGNGKRNEKDKPCPSKPSRVLSWVKKIISYCSFSPHIGHFKGQPNRPFKDELGSAVVADLAFRTVVVASRNAFATQLKTTSGSGTEHSYGENGCYHPFEDLVFDIWRHSPDDLNEASKNVLLWARSVVVVLSRMFGKTENANVQVAIWSELREESERVVRGFLTVSSV